MTGTRRRRRDADVVLVDAASEPGFELMLRRFVKVVTHVRTLKELIARPADDENEIVLVAGDLPDAPIARVVQEVLRKWTHMVIAAHDPVYDTLTELEMAMCDILATGLTPTKDVVAELEKRTGRKMSPSYIEHRVGALRRKLNCRNRVELAVAAMGIVQAMRTLVPESPPEGPGDREVEP